MRRTLVAALLALSLTAPARADMANDCEQTADWDRQIGGCTAVIDSGHWTGARLAWAYTNRGLAYQFRGRNREALENIDQALALNPLDPQALNIRGFLRARLGDSAGATVDWERSFALGGPAFVRSHQDWMQARGHYAGAIDGVYRAAMRRALFACAEDPAC